MFSFVQFNFAGQFEDRYVYEMLFLWCFVLASTFGRYEIRQHERQRSCHLYGLRALCPGGHDMINEVVMNDFAMKDH